MSSISGSRGDEFGVDWLLRVGNGNNYTASIVKKIWGIDPDLSCGKYFCENVKVGDRLWYVKSGGQLVGVATFTGLNKRQLGPLISVTYTNEDLGWTETGGPWDMEVHYKDLYDISDLNLNSKIKGAVTIRLYNPQKCNVNLPQEYPLIVRYSKVKQL